MAEQLDDCEMYEEEVSTASTSVVQQQQLCDREGTQTELDYEKCIICRTCTDERLSQLKTGFPFFLSNLQSTGRFDIYNEIRKQQNPVVLLHLSCRRKLSYEATKADRLRTEGSSLKQRRTRSAAVPFSFKDCCFLCGESVCGSTDARKVASGSSFDEKIRKVVTERGKERWAMEIDGRLSFLVSDLFAADAVYHNKCYLRFTVAKLPHTPKKKKLGRPIDLDALKAFTMLCEKLELECENEFYTLTELYEMMVTMAIGQEEDCSTYGKGYLKGLLQKRYGEHIYFVSRPGRDDVVGFKNYCDLLLHNKFFCDRNEGEGTEAERIVQKAAGLVMAEIREMMAAREFYPCDEDIAGNGLKFIPKLLQLFLKRIIQDPMKIAGLGQGLVQAARPQGLLMPILFGIGVEADHSGGENFHIQLARFGFSLSHDEIRRFKHSVLLSAGECQGTKETVVSESTVVSASHFVADNVDHNIRTLDGLNSFHGMGIIVAHGSFSSRSDQVRRSSKPVKVSELCKERGVKILSLECFKSCGVSNVELLDLRSLSVSVDVTQFTSLNVLWHSGGRISSMGRPRPNWSGFMQSTCQGDFTSTSTVEMLEIIDMNPSDESCILSSLVYMIGQAKMRSIPVPSVTFDQPLYIKAVDVAMKANLDIVIRLGGFHTLMSFLGSIGHLMRGSGLEEVMGSIFGPNTVEHIFSGKAYARAVRGHFIVQSVLIDLLLDYLKSSPSDFFHDDQSSPVAVASDAVSVLAGTLSADDIDELNHLYDDLMRCKVYVTETNSVLLMNSTLLKLSTNLDRLCDGLTEQSRTARLWLQYVRYVQLLKLFLYGERTGNWLIHLHAVKGMLGLFACTGHINYAKSSRLYLQQMVALPVTHPVLHHQFDSGCHSIRRSNRFWAGLSTDLVIEQTMMRSIKTRGGLTRGRGMHETARETWLGSLSACAGVRSALEQATGSRRATSDHIEVGKSRMDRDSKDFCKVKAFLTLHSPFRFVGTERLVSLCSGVAAGLDDNVNCDKADELGSAIQAKWNNCKYGDISCKKADNIKTMAHLMASCAIEDDAVCVDPMHLFHRLVIVGERQSNLRECFAFEMTPYPLSMFKDGLMRKPDKPSLYTDFTKGLQASLPPGVQYVVDGGYLLHKVRWNPSMGLREILQLFSNFLKRYGCGVEVVFDGYSSGPTVKDHEHARRSGKAKQISPVRQLDLNTKEIGHQELFLSNTTNKSRFIAMLMEFLRSEGLSVHQADSDADTLIVAVALDCASRIGENPIGVLAEDTDILVLLLHHRKTGMKPIYFISEAKKGREGKMVGGKCFSIGDVQKKIGLDACARLLAVHALGGCDSTSAIFSHGKGTIFRKVDEDKTGLLHRHCMTLQNPEATDDEVCSATSGLFVALYCGKAGDRLANLRYEDYCKMSLSKRFQPERLPPSESAAHMHGRRVHLQAVIWETLGNSSIKATDWGWLLEKNCLKPIKLIGDIAPQDVLKFVRCNCKGNCSSTLCSCRKNGLHCVSACGQCHGTACTNAGLSLEDDAVDSGSEEVAAAQSVVTITEDTTASSSQFFFDDDVDFFYEEEV